MQQHVHHGVGLALDGGLHRGEAPPGDGVCLIEEEHRVLPLSGPEDRGDVLGGLSHPAGLELGIAHHEQLPVERVRERLGADGLSRPGRPGEVKGETQTGGVPLGQTPLAEDEIVLVDEGQRVIQRPQRPLRQHHVVEGAERLDRLDQLPRRGAEEEVANGIGHAER